MASLAPSPPQYAPPQVPQAPPPPPMFGTGPTPQKKTGGGNTPRYAPSLLGNFGGFTGMWGSSGQGSSLLGSA